ncbi:MAG: T9SS type A sorting domain-containing protein [Bacteroidetes bacterium]|nr:T9SS type A sorting domain-containing protein [Bacteroidota bacterium]
MSAQAVFVSNCAPYPNYTITVKATPISLVIKNAAAWGCNIDVVFAYTLSVNGSIANGWCGGGGGGSLNNAKLSINCSGGNFGIEIPHTAATGTIMTGNNQGFYTPYCTGVTANSYCSGANTFATVSGPGINNSTISLNNALPIELFAFTAEKVNEHIVLYWSTASEVNNDFFTIEKSSDASHWEEIGTVKGAGTSTTNRYYSFTDENAYQGLNYYRLKQTDYNKNFKYSYIVDVNALQTKASDFIMYPNPAGKTVSLYGLQKPISINVLDELGQKLDIPVDMDESSAKLNLEAMTQGVYSVTVIGATETITKKLIIQN